MQCEKCNAKLNWQTIKAGIKICKKCRDIIKYFCIDCGVETKGGKRCKSCNNVFQHENNENFGFKNKKHSENFKRYISKIQKENNSFAGRHHSEETKQNISNSLLGRKKPESHGKKISKTRKKLFKEGKLESNIKYCIKSRYTSIEIEVEKQLIEMKIKFEKQFPILFKNKMNCNRRRWYDFYLPEYNMLIEVDGRYWHKENNKNDIFKNNLAKKNGYRLIRIWGDEIDKIWRIIN